MPRNPKYPLEALREHRARGVDAATAELGAAVRAREVAEAAKLRAEEERARAEARARAVRENEAVRLRNGELKVVDLVRAGDWDKGAQHEIAELSRAVDRAEMRASEARAAERTARDELARRKADRDVVAKDEARFVERLVRDREAAEEDAADEVFAARRREG